MVATALATVVSLVPMTVAAGPAGATPGGGSIVHTQGSDVWLTNPEGTTQVRVTDDGATPSPDATGDTAYFSPSQDDSGNIIVAVRNQLQPDGSRRGFLWVMDRDGNVVQKLSPPQYGFIRTTCSTFNQSPSGISTAQVSPDGSKIVYEDAALLRSATCGFPDQITAVRVVNLDGSNPQLITRTDGTILDLHNPSWASSSRLVLRDTFDPGPMSYVDLPDPQTRAWFSPELHEATAWPVLKADKLATTGPTFFDWRGLVLWTANGGPPTPPTPRCGLSDPVRNSFTPTWAPGGSAVAWWEANADDPADTAGRGIWAVSVGNLATTCPTRADARLIVPGGGWPFWGPADVAAPPLRKQPADFDGNGSSDKAVFRPSTGQWFVRGGSPEVTQYGVSGDIPVPGDYDGGASATTDKAVFRPSTGQWFVRGGSPEVTQYGASGDIPVPGDYDGGASATTDKAVYRPSTGQWFVWGGSPEVTQYGAGGDIPVPGDYDGNGTVDKAVFRPSTGQWFVRGGSPEVTQYGVSGDQPQPGDFGGDGTTDKAVYRPSTGQWFVRGGSPEVTQYGAGSDIALPLPYAIRRVFFP
ncbi:MAG: TolB family protein [Acidimicrobiales bacterium]